MLAPELSTEKRTRRLDYVTMPASPPRPCLHFGCPRLVLGRHARCREHQTVQHRQDARERGTAQARGYTAAWSRISKRVLAEEPLCRACGAAYSELTDHIIPKAQGGTDERRNLQGLCRSCHAVKTARESA